MKRKKKTVTRKQRKQTRGETGITAEKKIITREHNNDYRQKGRQDKPGKEDGK